VGTDSPVCSLGITTISPGVNALRLHGWHHPILSYLCLVLFFLSAYQPFSWCWCGPDTRKLSKKATITECTGIEDRRRRLEGRIKGFHRKADTLMGIED